jgi:hypothetical protein
MYPTGKIISFDSCVYANQMYLLHRSIHKIDGSTLGIYKRKIIKKSELFITFSIFID